MRTISLTKGKVALVDDADYARASQYKWHAVKRKRTWYPSRLINMGSKRHQLFLHAFLLEPMDGLQVDHRDGDGLNCTRANMRLCTPAENTRNRRRPVTNTSGYKGVSWHKLRGKWIAWIGLNGRNKYLGLFESKRSAAQAYNEAALKYYGEFACLNTIGGV